QAAIAAYSVNVVVEKIEAGPVVAVGQPFARDRHADAGGNALPQRTCGGLDPRYPVIFRMPWRLAVELAKAADVVERDRRLAEALILGVHGPGTRQVQDRPQQHRGVAIGQDEAVAIGPDRILRIEAQDAVPQRVDQRSQRHGRTRMARVGLLDRIYRQSTDGIDCQLIELFTGHAIRPQLQPPFFQPRFRYSLDVLDPACCSRCPPNSKRMADSNLSAKSASPLELNRS